MKGENTLISELNNSVECIGINKTIEVLKEGRHKVFKDIHMSYVYETINETLGITFDQLNEKHSRDDLRKVAMGMYFYFGCNVFGYKPGRVYSSFPVKGTHRIFQKYRRLVCKANTIKPRTEIDRLVVKHLAPLETHFTNYKKSNNINGNK